HLPVEARWRLPERVLCGDAHRGCDRGSGEGVRWLSREVELRRRDRYPEVGDGFRIATERPPTAATPGLVHHAGLPVIRGTIGKPGHGDERAITIRQPGARRRRRVRELRA